MNWLISGSGRPLSPPGWRAATTENTSAFRSHHWVIQPGFVKFLRIYGLVYHSEGNNPTSLTAGFDLLTLPSHISMNSPTIGGWLALIGWLPQWRKKLRNSRVFDRELSTHSFSFTDLSSRIFESVSYLVQFTGFDEDVSICQRSLDFKVEYLSGENSPFSSKLQRTSV